MNCVVYNRYNSGPRRFEHAGLSFYYSGNEEGGENSSGHESLANDDEEASTPAQYLDPRPTAWVWNQHIASHPLNSIKEDKPTTNDIALSDVHEHDLFCTLRAELLDVTGIDILDQEG